MKGDEKSPTGKIKMKSYSSTFEKNKSELQYPFRKQFIDTWT